MKEEIVDNEETLDTVNGIEDVYRTIKDLKKDYPEKIEKLEEALLNYMGENDLKFLKTGFPDKWKFLTKKRACYEYFKSFDDYQKLFDNLNKQYFFSKLKNGYPDDEEIERTMDFI